MTMDLMKLGEDVSVDIKRRNIALPKNYSVSNALAAAHLILQGVVDKNKKPVLEVCTSESIKQCLFSMIVQGLNPIKKQCSFIAYGDKLTLSREYMGSITVAKRVDENIKDIRAQVIYEGDQVKSVMKNGRRHIEHEQDFVSMARDKIIGAYALAVDEAENQIYTDIMDMATIKQSWKQSKVHPVAESGKINPDSTHGKFTEEMCKKTVYGRLCKSIINSSDDETLLRAVEESDEDVEHIDIVNNEAKENGNKKLIDFNKAKEKEPPPPTEPQMATIEQARMITGLSVELNQKDAMMQQISGYFNDNFKKISELTFNQANEYIDILNDQIKELPKADAGPSWE